MLPNDIIYEILSYLSKYTRIAIGARLGLDPSILLDNDERKILRDYYQKLYYSVSIMDNPCVDIPLMSNFIRIKRVTLSHKAIRNFNRLFGGPGQLRKAYIAKIGRTIHIMAKTFDGMYYIVSSHNHQESEQITKNSLIRYVFDPCSVGNGMIRGIKINLYTPGPDSNIKKKRKILNDIQCIL